MILIQLIYIDPSEEETQEINMDDILQKSINFVNKHGGWTDNYRYVGLDNDKKTVLFRIYVPDGYPIFSENNPISELNLEWGKTILAVIFEIIFH